jgi:hypothetical protein
MSVALCLLSLNTAAGALSSSAPLQPVRWPLLPPRAVDAAASSQPFPPPGWAQDFSCKISYLQTTVHVNQSLTGSAFVSGSTKKIRFSVT